MVTLNTHSLTSSSSVEWASQHCKCRFSVVCRNSV